MIYDARGYEITSMAVKDRARFLENNPVFYGYTIPGVGVSSDYKIEGHERVVG